jgi:ribonuclease J
MRENNKNNAQDKNTRAKRSGQRNTHSSERRFNSRKSGENRRADEAGDRLGRELGLKPKTQSSSRHTANIHRGARTRNDTHARKKPESIKIFPIGGLDEIGKNMTLLEYKDQILIIDCGMSFPDDSMYGIDVVIPDFSYVVKNAAKVKGLIITHGHEDHIGGVPYLLKQINVPIYGTPLSLGLIRNKLEEHGIRGNLNVIHAGDTFKVGAFEIEAIHTTHSIADAVCYFIKTPAARIFHTGDFKIDYTPVDGDPIDLGRLAEIGDSGVDLMMCDSTNVVRPGYTRSERVVGESLDGIFREAENRIIIATFSSNVNRIQKIIELSVKYGRKFAVSGRSMDNVVKLAMELGYLKFPAGSYVELNQTRGIPDSKLTIITTGSQGEPLSALARMAADEHRNVKLKKGDTVILSSTPVPGNEKSVSRVVNQLYQKQVHVIYNENADIHVSGHACQEDLKLMHSLIRPKFFMPVHGEHRHLIIHRQLAEQLGEKKDHIFILSNGDQLTLTKKRAIRFKNVVPAEDIMVDGLGIGDVGNIVLKDRQLLSESGLILVVAGVDTGSGTLVSGPEIVSRGFVYVKENEGLIAESRKVAQNAIEKSLAGGFQDWNSLKNDVRDDLRRFIFQKTRRSPLILPVFLQI